LSRRAWKGTSSSGLGLSDVRAAKRLGRWVWCPERALALLLSLFSQDVGPAITHAPAAQTEAEGGRRAKNVLSPGMTRHRRSLARVRHE